MRLLLSLVLLAAPGPAVTPPPAAAALADAEAKALLHLRQTFERVGRLVPGERPRAHPGGPDARPRGAARDRPGGGGTRIGLAVSEAGGWDPNPRLVLIRSWRTRDDAPEPSCSGRNSPPSPPPTPGWRWWPTTTTPCSRCSWPSGRRWSNPSRGRSPAPSRQRLCFELRAPLGRPSVFVPGRRARWTGCRISGAGSDRCARCPSRGTAGTRWRSSEREPRVPRSRRCSRSRSGPRVARGRRRCARGAGAESPRRRGCGCWPGQRAAERGRGVAVEPDPARCGGAAYAERMATQRFFATSRRTATPSLTGSSRAATLRTSGENLGMASGPLAAHAAIEESPGHRKNLLNPAFQRVGFGLARQARDGGSEECCGGAVRRPRRRWSADPVAAAYAASRPSARR